MTGYLVVDHACRTCLGRLIERQGEYRCPTCDATAKGRPEGICGCGVVVSETGRRPFRCATNPSPSPKNPARVIIALVDGGVPAF